MAAPSTDYPALGASTSSSGFTDGLGRRSLAFDREGGTMLERLAVRAELSAFERSLRDRLDRIGAMDDERLAKPRSIERAPDGSLFVFSEFVPGTRLSDLLDATAQEGSAPGVDVALGFLLDVLPALCGLHAGAGFTHGAIGPGRTVLTPAGQVVLLDGIFGDALAHLQYTRRRLWTEFGIAMPPAAGPPRFDAANDIAQAALSAVMLVLGRQLADYDYPDGIPTLLADVVEVAQIRGSSDFADGLATFFQRALPLSGRKPYTAADDALIDLRDLARELGLDTCRRALVEFIEGQNGVSAAAAGEGYADAFVYDALATPGTNGDETYDDEENGTELELDLDGSRGGQSESEETYYDLSSAEESPAEEPASSPAFQDAPIERPDFSEFAALPDVAPEPVAEFKPAPEPEALAASKDEFQADSYQDTTAADAAAPLAASSAEPDAAGDGEYESDRESESEHEEAASVEEPVEDAKSSRRRKRARSVRSRKDKLQSAARPQKLAPPPPPPVPAPPIPAASVPPAPAPVPLAAAKPTSSGWLVEPSKAASFDPPVPVAPVQPPPPAPRPIVLAPPVPVSPPVPVAPIVVAPPLPPPVAMPAPPLRPVAPVIAAPPIPLQKPSPPVPLAPAVPAAVKLKTEPPAGYAPPRRPRAEPVEDIYGPRAAAPVDSGSGGFPWKIASGGLVLLVVALVAGRAYMTSGGPEAEPTRKGPALATAPVAPTAPAVLPKTGRIQIETEPAGARVLLDGKHVGDSPVTIEAAAGRHTLTLATSTGSVRRTVRVDAGKTVTLSVPIFSGWVDVASPIILEVSEDGKLLGTTEQNRLLLRPGRHVLTFTNRDLDYSTVQTIDIEPGEAKTLTLDPKGTVNLNATPWAEVWIDGKKVGDTPLANLEIPLGTREIVFKNTGYVEQRVTRTVRANAPLAISVEMVKQ